jgi:hypothetical protein
MKCNELEYQLDEFVVATASAVDSYKNGNLLGQLDVVANVTGQKYI